MVKSNRIKTFLWFDGPAEEAARFYTSIFRNGKVVAVTRYPEGSPRPAGSVMTVQFELDGQTFVALNGGPQFKFNESVSFAVECDSQEEIDYYWDRLLAGGGRPGQCGWLEDRFGVFWQVVPARLDKLFTGKKAEQVMQAMLAMVKLNVAKLEEAAK